MSEPRRILLVRLSHMGDVVHALPIHHALRRAYPDARLAWVVQPEFADLVEGLEDLECVFRFGRRDGFAAWPRLARELRAWRPDWAIDAQGNLKSAAITMLSRAARRTGLHATDWREPFGARVLNDSAPKVGEPHAMNRMIALARHVAPELAPEDCARVDPGLTPTERARGAELFAQQTGERDAVLLHLATPGDVRSWPTERFGELARSLAEAGRRVVLLSGPAEADCGARLERELAGTPRITHWVGQRGLRELAAFFDAAAAHGARIVTCDSGPMHLAAACGLRVTALAGPQNHERTGPWPVDSVHRIVRASDSPECAPCLRRRCDHPEGPVCMTRISTESVHAATTGALDGSTPCPV